MVKEMCFFFFFSLRFSDFFYLLKVAFVFKIEGRVFHLFFDRIDDVVCVMKVHLLDASFT